MIRDRLADAMIECQRLWDETRDVDACVARFPQHESEIRQHFALVGVLADVRVPEASERRRQQGWLELSTALTVAPEPAPASLLRYAGLLAGLVLGVTAIGAAGAATDLFQPPSPVSNVIHEIEAIPERIGVRDAPVPPPTPTATPPPPTATPAAPATAPVLVPSPTAPSSCVPPGTPATNATVCPPTPAPALPSTPPVFIPPQPTPSLPLPTPTSTPPPASASPSVTGTPAPSQTSTPTATPPAPGVASSPASGPQRDATTPTPSTGARGDSGRQGENVSQGNNGQGNDKEKKDPPVVGGGQGNNGTKQDETKVTTTKDDKPKNNKD